jgi:metallo-beta-lactamase class B
LSLSRISRSLLACLLLAALVVLAAGQGTSSSCSECAEWNQPQKPFRVFGNTYYVGPHGLSSILITSPTGHILIDGALPESARQIAASIQSLGFRIQDVKIILNTHVHFDHAGGIAALQRMSGARVIASEWSADVMKRGGVGRGDPQYGIVQPIQPIRRVSTVRDREIITVGELSVTTHLTPGHTPGGTSWTWKSCEGDICHDMVYADSLTPVSASGFRFTGSREYPHVLEDFEKGFAFLDTAPCDVLITTHPDTSAWWDRVAARERGVKPDPLVDTGACRELAQHAREQLRERLAEERKTK